MTCSSACGVSEIAATLPFMVLAFVATRMTQLGSPIVSFRYGSGDSATKLHTPSLEKTDLVLIVLGRWGVCAAPTSPLAAIPLRLVMRLPLRRVYPKILKGCTSGDNHSPACGMEVKEKLSAEAPQLPNNDLNSSSDRRRYCDPVANQWDAPIDHVSERTNKFWALSTASPSTIVSNSPNSLKMS